MNDINNLLHTHDAKDTIWIRQAKCKKQEKYPPHQLYMKTKLANR